MSNMTYIITIFYTDSQTKEIYSADNEEEFNYSLEKLLGGWSNLHYAMTSGSNLRNKSYACAGSTKDGSKMFSILVF